VDGTGGGGGGNGDGDGDDDDDADDGDDYYEGWNFNSGNYLFTTDTK